MSNQTQELEGKFMATVKLGPKGQLVIPKEARELYGLHPGDSMLLLADRERGIALVPQSRYHSLVELFSQAFSQFFPDSKSS